MDFYEAKDNSQTQIYSTIAAIRKQADDEETIVIILVTVCGCAGPRYDVLTARLFT